MNKKVIAILAVDEDFWIGKSGDIPWKSDLKNFKEITTKTQKENKQNALIMWRKTWESIPEKFRPFSLRKNIVISRENLQTGDLFEHFYSIKEAILSAKKDKNIENIFIIGWASIYNYAFENNLVDKIYLTFIPWKYDCDTFVKLDLEKYDKYFERMIQVWEEKYLFCKYKKNNNSNAKVYKS